VVHDTAIVGVCQRVGRLYPVPQCVLHLKRAGLHDVAQRTAVDVFHGDERPAVLFADLVDGADVRVIERGRAACLAHQLRARRLILDGRSQDLDSEPALERGVVGEEHDAHAAPSEPALDDVLPRVSPG